MNTASKLREIVSAKRHKGPMFHPEPRASDLRYDMKVAHFQKANPSRGVIPNRQMTMS